MKEADIIEYAYDDEVQLNIEFSTKYMVMFSKFAKLNSACCLHLSRNQPLKLVYDLNSWMETDDEDKEVVNYIRFYLAPQMGDEDLDSD